MYDIEIEYISGKNWRQKYVSNIEKNVHPPFFIIIIILGLPERVRISGPLN